MKDGLIKDLLENPYGYSEEIHTVGRTFTEPQFRDDSLKEKFRGFLQSSGMIEVNADYDKNVGCYKTIRVLTNEEEETIPSHFNKMVEKANLRGVAKRYEKDSRIWVFKVYE